MASSSGGETEKENRGAAPIRIISPVKLTGGLSVAALPPARLSGAKSKVSSSPSQSSGSKQKVAALMRYRLMSKHDSEWPCGIPKRDGKEGCWQASLKQSI